MAIGDITPKRLYQGYLSATPSVLYTTPSNTRTQIIEIWVDNQNTTTDRKISLYTPDINIENRINHNIPVTADTGVNIADNKIVLQTGEKFGMSQDIGTDLLVTIYGYEEVIA